MYRQVDSYLRALPASEHSALEISGDFYRDLGWRDYEQWHYPDFDVCAPGEITRQFDVVICDQVLEHVVDPFAAARTLADLCRDGGHVVVGVPFLVRVHPAPADYWRFTPEGLRVLLERAGLEVPEVMSFGNRQCVKANFLVWAPKPRWGSNANEPEFPVNVWAIAGKPSAQHEQVSH
jgi:hypothetical protein